MNEIFFFFQSSGVPSTPPAPFPHFLTISIAGAPVLSVQLPAELTLTVAENPVIVSG
jgi:hypothetical protein